MSNAHSRTDSRYWIEKVKQSSHGEYGVQIHYKGKRVRFPLATAKKNEACIKSAKIFSDIELEGWNKAIELHKPHTVKKISEPTFGDVFQAVESVSSVKTNTLNKYIGKCRTIITAIKNIDTDNSRYRKGSAGNKKWLQAVDNTKLTEITPVLVREWRDNIINSRSGGDPNSQEGHRAKISTNSTLRQARSLFGAGCLSKLRDKGINLPDPFPFHDKDEKQNPIFSKVELKRIQYKSVIDIPSLLNDGKKELADEPENQNLWLALTLGVLVGLDRIVMDRLLWDQVDTLAGTITIKNTQYFTSAKNAFREDTMHLDEETASMLQGYKAKANAKGEIFVLESKGSFDYSRTDDFYRCKTDFKKLIAWLRKKGITDLFPIRALRKELASHVYETQGLDAASKILRHSNTATTQRHYADPNKLKPVSGLGHLLTPSNIEELPTKKQA